MMGGGAKRSTVSRAVMARTEGRAVGMGRGVGIKATIGMDVVLCGDRKVKRAPARRAGKLNPLCKSVIALRSSAAHAAMLSRRKIPKLPQSPLHLGVRLANGHKSVKPVPVQRIHCLDLQVPGDRLKHIVTGERTLMDYFERRRAL